MRITDTSGFPRTYISETGKRYRLGSVWTTETEMYKALDQLRYQNWRDAIGKVHKRGLRTYFIAYSRIPDKT